LLHNLKLNRVNRRKAKEAKKEDCLIF